MTESIQKTLYDMAAEEDFYYLDIDSYCKNNEEKLKKCVNIFKIQDEKSDFILETAKYLIAKRFANFETITKPDNFEQYKKLVLACFIFDLSFFSMCWNYMMLEKHHIEIKAQRTNSVFSVDFASINNFNVYDYQEYKAAGSEGIRKFGNDHEISGFGKIGQMCDNTDKEYQFYIELEEAAASKKFTVEIEFKNKDENYKVKIISLGDGKKLLRSDCVEVSDIYSGIHNLIIKIIPS